jgi:hypothetical protein
MQTDGQTWAACICSLHSQRARNVLIRNPLGALTYVHILQCLVSVDTICWTLKLRTHYPPSKVLWTKFINQGLHCIVLKVWGILKIQSEHKRTLHFKNDTENKCDAFRTSHLHQSIEKLSKFCTHLTETRYVLRESHGRCRDYNPTRTAKSSSFEARTNWILYGFICKRLRRILETVCLW